MSTDENPQVPARRESREAVREKAALVQAKQRRGRIARTSVISVVVVAIVAAAGVAVAWSFVSQGSQPELAPAGMQDDGVVVTSVSSAALAAVGADAGASPAPATDSSATTTAPVEVSIYVDYLSSDSADFETANAKQIAEWVAQGAAHVSYHPVALLTAKSNGTKYSLRAAAAAACVATHEPAIFVTFNHELLAQKPAADTDGLSDKQLADIAQAAGATDPQTVRTCIEQGSFKPWVQDATTRALSTNVGTTGSPINGPTVLVNGTPYVGALDSAKEFAQFVLTIASDAYFKSATPSPTPAP